MANAVYEPVNADIKFKQSTWEAHPRWTSDKFHGFIYPAYVFEMLPGDRFSGNLRHFTRMAAPIAPVFGDFIEHVAVMFVPKRIIFDKTKQFYGEAEDFGIASEVKEPTTNAGAITVARTDNVQAYWMSIANAFGLIRDGNVLPVDVSKQTHINLLPLRGFLACYNEYFRNENYQAKYMWDKSQSGYGQDRVIATLGANSIGPTSDLPQCNKIADLFTSILPYQLKSNDPVAVSIAGSVDVEDNGPIVFGQKKNDGTFYSGNYSFLPVVPAYTDGGEPYMDIYGVSDTGDIVDNISLDGGTYSRFAAFLGKSGGSSEALPQFTDIPDSMHKNAVPLTYLNGLKATHQLTASLNSLIYALSYQYFLSRLAKGGSKYGEYIEVIFGVKCPAAVRDEPEFIAHASWKLNVDTVVQTTGHADGDTSELGQVGANSQTGGSQDLFNFACTEPGYLYVVTYTKHTRSYSTGLNPMFLKDELMDYYQTPFGNMPDVTHPMANLWFTGADSTDKSSLGFVEPYVEYKRFPDRCCGLMNPMNPGSSDFWTTGEKFNDEPVINSDFLKENRNTIKRILTSGNNGPDYVCDFILDLKISRVMPLYSTGLGKM